MRLRHDYQRQAIPPSLLAHTLVLGVALMLGGCALGGVRQARASALGPYRDVTAVAAEAPASDEPAVLGETRTAATTTLASRMRWSEAEASEAAAFRLALRVVELREATSQASTLDEAAGRLGLGARASAGAGRLVLEARLLAPGEGGEELGAARWEGVGDPAQLASRAGRELAEALARELDVRRDEWVARRAADERLVLAPTPQTLPAGSVVLSNDELLLFRAGVGLSRRVQLDGWLGGLPLPVAAGGAVPLPHVVVAGGGAGLGALATADVGLKVRVLDESRYVPAVALSYDFLNVFGGVLGAGGVLGVGNGVAVAGAGLAGGANLQFNLFGLSVGKHFGRTHVVAGTWLLDNHHLVPQSAGISYAGAAGVPGEDTGGSGTGSASTPLERVPTQVQPFVAVEQVLGEHSALNLELFPRAPLKGSFGTTGVRWLLGSDTAAGPLALDRVRVRVDLAAVWTYLPPSERQSRGMVLPLPWVGLGLYVR